MSPVPNEFEFVRELCRERAGVVLPPGEDFRVELRLFALCKREGAEGLGQLVELLKSTPHGALHDEVVESLVDTSTRFFGDGRTFDALRTRLLPELVERNRESGELAIWSAGCASGQETWSLALLLRQELEEPAAWRLTLLGSDLSESAIGRAQEGVYNALEVGRGLSRDDLANYFRPRGQRWAVGEEVRSGVVFRTLNLLEPPAGVPPMDVVLLRNVLRDLDDDARGIVLGHVLDVLKPGGILLLGDGERADQMHSGFEAEPVAGTFAFHPRAAAAEAG